MSMLLCLVISVMVCSSVCALKTSDRLTTQDFAFLVHHKTGTFLSDAIVKDMASVLNSTFRLPNFVYPDQCYSNTIAIYDRETLKAIKTCPRMRAVHIVRRPTSALISDYVFEKNLDPFNIEQLFWFSKIRSEVFQNEPLSVGIQKNCQWWYSSWPNVGHEIDDIVETHQYIQMHGLPILEVRLEDFESNYDKTARSIFEHFLGNNDPRIDALVKLASKHDLSRNQESQIEAIHVTSKSEKAEALMEVKRQYLAGDPCIRKLVESDQLLGYDSQTKTW